jgi:hypothetical protein
MKILAPVTGRTYEMVYRPVERDAIVVSGKFKFQPLPGVKNADGRPTIHLFVRDGEVASMPNGVGGGTSGIGGMMMMVGEITGYPIMYDTPPANGIRVNWRQQESVAQMADKRVGPADAGEVDALLANVSKQTSLELKRGKRVVEMWVPKE